MLLLPVQFYAIILVTDDMYVILCFFSGASNKVYEPKHVETKTVISKNTASTEELRNYASNECGAKVISTNKEAQKQQSVLNENRDEYIMQPCSARCVLV